MSKINQHIRKGNIFKVQELLRIETNIHSPDDGKDAKTIFDFYWQFGELPLFTAVAYKRLGIAWLLLQNGANPHIKDHALSCTPIELALLNDDLEMVELLTTMSGKEHWQTFAQNAEDYQKKIKSNSSNTQAFFRKIITPILRNKELEQKLKSSLSDMNEEFDEFLNKSQLTVYMKDDNPQDFSHEQALRYLKNVPATPLINFSAKPPKPGVFIHALPAATFSYYIEQSREAVYRYIPSIIYSQYLDNYIKSHPCRPLNFEKSPDSILVENLMHSPRRDLCIAPINFPNGYANHGLFSIQDIKKEEFLGVFEGFVGPQENQHSDYSLGPFSIDKSEYTINPEHIGGLMSFINYAPSVSSTAKDIPPEAVFANVEAIHILWNNKHYALIKTVEDIPAYSQLLFDYGDHWWHRREKKPFYFNKNAQIILADTLPKLIQLPGTKKRLEEDLKALDVISDENIRSILPTFYKNEKISINLYRKLNNYGSWGLKNYCRARINQDLKNQLPKIKWILSIPELANKLNTKHLIKIGTLDKELIDLIIQTPALLTKIKETKKIDRLCYDNPEVAKKMFKQHLSSFSRHGLFNLSSCYRSIYKKVLKTPEAQEILGDELQNLSV